MKAKILWLFTLKLMAKLEQTVVVKRYRKEWKILLRISRYKIKVTT